MPKRKRKKKNKYPISKSKIWFFGNTGGRYRDLKVPENIDMAVFTGDIANQTGVAAAYDFIEWYKSLKIPYKLFIPGGKDTAFGKQLIDISTYMKSIIFPDDRLVQARRLKFFGTSKTDYRRFQNQHDSFVISEDKMLDFVIKHSATKVDILMTNEAPYGILDLKPSLRHGEVFSHHGSEYILDLAVETKPKIHAFSKVSNEKHIANAGLYTHPSQNTLFINCSCTNNEDELEAHGIVIEV